MTTLLKLDIIFTNAIYTLPHSPLIDHFFMFFSLIGSYGLVWIILLIAIAIYEKRRHRSTFIPLIISLLLTLIVVNGFLKPQFARPRPLSSDLPIALFISYSFPSLHASASFAGAYIMTHFHQTRGWLFYLVAFLVSFSRIYLGFHYVSDVFVGGIVGSCIAFGTYAMLKGKIKKS